MNAKIFSFVKVADDSMIASVRIARFLAETLQLPLCWDESVADVKLDVLMIVNGAFAFSGSALLEALGRAIVDASRVVWVQNDYTVVPPKDESGAESPFRKAFRTRREQGKPPVDYWSTCEEFSRPGQRSSTGHYLGSASRYVNWNCLTVEDRPVCPWEKRERPMNLVYYGSYRKGREIYFDRYFKSCPVGLTISSPSNKFMERYELTRDRRHVEHLKKFASSDLYDELSHYGLGLYIEDKASHKSYHSPANRIYEMLSAGLPIVFQQEASRMLARAGFDTTDYEIWEGGPQSLPSLMERREEILLQQRELWWPKVLVERQDLDRRVREMWEDYQ